MDGGGHGADLLAGSVLAVHARNGLEDDLRVAGWIAGEVPVDADPVHLAPFLTWALPTTGMLFSLWQAVMHALQPVQAFRSIVIPH